jgi:hypothetical protein
MTFAVIYRNSDGAIVGRRSYEADHPANAAPLPAGCSLLESESLPNESDSYINGTPAFIAARPTTACTLDKSTITANGTDTATLSSIPIGATVAVTDGNGTTTYTATDSTLEITADDPGQISVTVTPAFPYIALTVTVTAL